MNLYIPYAKLKAMLIFDAVGDGGGVVAKIGNMIISEFRIPVEADEKRFSAMKFWHEDVLRRLAGVSSTVVLQTACGCTQRLDVPKAALSCGWRMPLRLQRSAAEMNDITAEAAVLIRTFTYRGRFDQDGFKLLEEEVP